MESHSQRAVSAQMRNIQGNDQPGIAVRSKRRRPSEKPLVTNDDDFFRAPNMEGEVHGQVNAHTTQEPSNVDGRLDFPQESTAAALLPIGGRQAPLDVVSASKEAQSAADILFVEGEHCDNSLNSEATNAFVPCSQNDQDNEDVLSIEREADQSSNEHLNVHNSARQCSTNDNEAIAELLAEQHSDAIAEGSSRTTRRRREKYPSQDPFNVCQSHNPTTGVLDVSGFGKPVASSAVDSQAVIGLQVGPAMRPLQDTVAPAGGHRHNGGTETVIANTPHEQAAAVHSDLLQISTSNEPSLIATTIDFSPIIFPLISPVQFSQVKEFLRRAIGSQLQRRKKLLLAAILCRFGDCTQLIRLLNRELLRNEQHITFLEQGDYDTAVECLIEERRFDLALSYAVRHNTSQCVPLAESIIKASTTTGSSTFQFHNWEDQVLQAAQEGFQNEMQMLGMYSAFETGGERYEASLVQVAAGYALEPSVRYNDNPIFSMYPVLSEQEAESMAQQGHAYKPEMEVVRICEIIEFSQLYALSNHESVRSLQMYDLNLLPFYPYLTEQKMRLFANEQEPMYLEVCLRHLKTMLRCLSAKKVSVKEATLRKSELHKFVSFSCQECQEWVTKHGERLYKTRGSDAPVEFLNLDENTCELGSYLTAPERLTVGQRLGSALTAGLGKLLGTSAQ